MATYKNFEDLEVWQNARLLCQKLHNNITEEWYKIDNSLKQQILASSGSIMDNIAEGFERGSTKEFIQFLAYSKGSCGELRSQVYRAFDKKLITETQFIELKDDSELVSRNLNGFISYLKTINYKGNRFNESEVEYSIEETNFKFQTSNL